MEQGCATQAVRLAWLRRAFSMLAGALLALSAAELVVRCFFYDVHYVYDAELGYLHAPGVMLCTGESPPAVSTWTVNGVRRQSPPDEQRPRVLVLGDSYAEALMIDDGDVFSDRLERALPRFQFLNAGRMTRSAADYIALAPVYIARLHPAWTVIQVNINDFAEDAFDHPDRSHFTWSPDGQLHLEVVTPPHKRGPTYWLRDRSMLAYFLWVRYGEYRASSGEAPLFRTASARPSPARTRDYPMEEIMDETVRAYDGRLTFALISPYHPEHPAEPNKDEARILAHCAARHLSCTSTRSGYRQFAHEGRSPFGFATSSFNEGHLNAAGHALLAQVIEAELRHLDAVL